MDKMRKSYKYQSNSKIKKNIFIKVKDKYMIFNPNFFYLM